MIEFGTGGFRGVIGDTFTRENIELTAAALAQVMREDGKTEKALEKGNRTAGSVARMEKKDLLNGYLSFVRCSIERCDES